MGEYVREGDFERWGARLTLSADQRWITLKGSGEQDSLQGTWRIDGSRLLLLKDGQANWAAAGSLTIVPRDSSFILVVDYDARKPLDEYHYFKRLSSANP